MHDRNWLPGRIWLVLPLVAAGAGASCAYMLSGLSGANSVSDSVISDVSKSIPSVTFETADGQLMTLADFQGKAILLNIWATWCPPCREEMPSLDRLQTKLGSDSFKVVPLSIDRTGIDVVKPFFDTIGIEKLAIYLDRSSSVISSLKVVGLPTTVLLGRDGRELTRWIGPKEWDSPAVIEEIQRHLAKTGEAS